MPSAKGYVRNYPEERRAKIKREGTKKDPKATKTTSQRNALRKKLKIPKGSRTTAGHGPGKLINKSGKTGGAGKKQSAKSNYSAGGKCGSRKGKAAGARKGHRSRAAGR